MNYCVSPRFESWIPPPQEDFPRPTWTKLIANGKVLSNSIEFADWTTDPAELIVCELCWNAECAHDGLARIVRLSSQVLWLRPRMDHMDEFTSASSFVASPVLMPREVWTELSNAFAGVPPFEELRRPTWMDMLGLWLDEIPPQVPDLLPRDPVGVDQLPRILDRICLAADPLSMAESTSTIRQLIANSNLDPSLYVEGDLLPIDETSSQINTFYFDGPNFPEWQSFTVDHNHLVIGNEWVFARRFSGT